ncbi:spore germination protein [Oxobacter pfennigii]|uniref:spore germination protein n=1 Tax=Oxobacter pfennigii TaxID=36849 RepID=UPI001FA726FE|nr:spore germination protein [Oxobacter pfennigii]
MKIIKRGKGKDDKIKPSGNEGAVSLSKSLKENEKLFKEIFEGDETIRYRCFETMDALKCMMIFTDGMVNSEIINENILTPVMNCKILSDTEALNAVDFLIEKVIASDDIRKETDIDEIVGNLLYGDTVLLVDGQDVGIIMNTKGWKTRSIVEPTAERTVKGPRDGFVESIIINTSLIRRRVRNPKLKFNFMELGKSTKTQISVCYIDGIANKQILEELLKRLKKIDIDGILASNYIEELIADSPLSIFKTTGYSERADVIVGKMLEGRIAILVDGTPVTITVPYIFMEYFQSYQDYYDNYYLASFNRIMRYMAFFLTTSISPIYLALVTYHPEMIPTPLLLSITSARQGIPFPTIVEALVLIFMFEILRESGTRLPEPVGSAVSIVGALVIGQAAVDARFVSAPITIIVAMTGITSFLVFSMNTAVIIIRFIFILLAGLLGLYGYIFGVIGLFINLMSMRSFGVPYMINLGSLNMQDIKDTIIRAPWWYMYYRPKIIGSSNPIRMPDAKPNKNS